MAESNFGAQLNRSDEHPNYNLIDMSNYNNASLIDGCYGTESVYGGQLEIPMTAKEIKETYSVLQSLNMSSVNQH